MAADTTTETEKPLEAEQQPPAVTSYRVAREAPDLDNLNTIDIFGERPFSV